jgi:hypothetical protein
MPEIYGIISSAREQNDREIRRGRIVGLVRSLGKRVYRKVSRVRIPPSPPETKGSDDTTLFVFAALSRPLSAINRFHFKECRGVVHKHMIQVVR